MAAADPRNAARRGAAGTGDATWWRDAVVYQVYPRSFQDSDGDGVGDLPGVIARLDHLAWLGVDALWLSPVYPSPGADMGYDVSDHTAVAADLGTLGDLDRLCAEAHDRGIRVLLDLVPSHTSIQHRWFREHSDWYVWADDGPPNNWLAAFGGRAWTRDELTGRWYLHSFYPEQPDLNWRVPEVRDAIGGVVRFWLDRGVDGFRVDAIDQLMKDRLLRDDPLATAPFPLPLPAEYARLEHVHSRNDAEIGVALEALRAAAGDAVLVGEVYLPTAGLGPYLEHLDLAFIFEFLHAPFEPGRLREVIAAGVGVRRPAWVASNHDFPRLATRLGAEGVPVAAIMLLTLPGAAFVYQGDEIGMPDGPGAQPPLDRAGRDRHRHPMQWQPTPTGGFTAGTPWLPLVDPAERSVSSQAEDPDSVLHLYRRLIELRRDLGPGFELLESAPDVVAYRRGGHAVALNLSSDPQPLPLAGELELSTHRGAERRTDLRPWEGVLLREA